MGKFKDNDKTVKLKDLFEEFDEISDKTRKIGQDFLVKIRPSLSQLEEEQTQRLLQDKTQRIGETRESTIVDEFWNYYIHFTADNPPSSDLYYGDDEAELKIAVLIRLFQDLYLERVYPLSFPVPIIQKSFRSTKNNQKPPATFFLVGDTHGSFMDVSKLIHFFITKIRESETTGREVKIIFIGDFVDRGTWDIHNLLYIMAFNLKFPKNVLCLRGNHEEITICGNYGFGKRVIDKFSKMLFASFTNMFKDLPLISVFHCNQGSVMCLHGGIPIIENDDGSYEVPQLNTYKFNNRQIFLDNMDPITQQILWNDPIVDYNPQFHEKFFNSRRGVGYMFGEEIFNEFCIKNHVDLLFRGHQVFLNGIHHHFENRFITIFSATEYAGKHIDARFIEMDSEDIFNFKVHVIQELSEN